MKRQTVTEQFKAVLEGKMAKHVFVANMRRDFPQYVTGANDYQSTLQILKTRKLLHEDISIPDTNKAKGGAYDLNVNLNSLDRGVRYELEAMGMVTYGGSIPSDAFYKAEAKAHANIKKDPLHYYNLIAKSSPSVDLGDQMKETKRGAKDTDGQNSMKKATLREGVEAPEGNVGTDKREAFKLTAHFLMSHHKIGGEEIKDFLRTHGDDILGMSYQEIADEYEQYASVNHDSVDDGYNTDPNTTMHIDDDEWEKEMGRKVSEKKGTDHDGDGDVDSDDYMAAKDKAIKKAMGKDVKEALKEHVKGAIQKVLSEAHTETLQRFIDDEYESEVQSAAKDLMDVVEALEKEFLKHKEKIEGILDGVGPFMAPAIYKAFKADLMSQRKSFEDVKQPATPRLTPDQIQQIDQARAAGELDEKELSI